MEEADKEEVSLQRRTRRNNKIIISSDEEDDLENTIEDCSPVKDASEVMSIS